MSVVDQIKARLDIVDVVGQTVKLRRTGKNYIGFCPFHQNTRTPAFVVFPESQTWRCFGQCNEGGDLFSYVMKRDGLDFSEALKKLAEQTGVELVPITAHSQAEQDSQTRLQHILDEAMRFYRQQMLETDAGKKALNYVKARGLSDETIKIWGLGYAPGGWDTLIKHFSKTGYLLSELNDAGLLTERDDGSTYDRFRDRLMFPIRNNLGKMTGFGARALNPDDVPKYLNSPKTELFDKGHLLFGMDLARREMRQLNQAVIVEGYMDVIALHQAGFKNVVASMGTALTEDQFGLIKRTTRNIVLALDADQAGQNATLRGLETARRTMGEELDLTFDSRGLLRFERFLKADIRVTTLPEGLDPDEIVNEDPEQWRKIIADAKPIVVHVMNTLAEGQDINDAKVKREIAAQVMPLIEDIGDPVEREAYRQQLANMLRIDERALRLSSSSSNTRQKSGYVTETEESPQNTALDNLPSITRRNRLLETHTLTYLLKEPEKLYQLNRQLGILDLPLVSIDDFQESDCKLAFGIVQESLEQDAEPAIDYIEQHLPDIFDMDEPNEQDPLVLKPSQSKSFYEQFRSFLRIRKNLIEDKVQEIQFLQADEEARPYSKDEADKLYLDLLTHRRVIDQALASALLPEDLINRSSKPDKKRRRM
jgi:DNA primase